MIEQPESDPAIGKSEDVSPSIGSATHSSIGGLEGRGSGTELTEAQREMLRLFIACVQDFGLSRELPRGTWVPLWIELRDPLLALASPPSSVARGAAADDRQAAFIGICGFTSHRKKCPQLKGPAKCTCGLGDAQEALIAALYPAEDASPAPLPDAAPVAWLPIAEAPRDSRPLIGYQLKLPERWIQVGLGTNLDGDWMWSQDVPWEPATHYQEFVAPVASSSPAPTEGQQ